MAKRAKVPIIHNDRMKSVIIHHGDLDGYNGAQVCNKWFETHVEDSHEIIRRRATYENVNDIVSAYTIDHEEYRYILIVDISITEDLALSAPDNLYIFDHHDTSSYLNGMNDRYYWEHEYCGAVVAWKALFSGAPEKPFKKLMKICNDYDMWQGNDGEPPKISFDMNTLFWLDPDKWYKKFYDGFSHFDDGDQAYLDKFWDIQDDLWENVIDKLVYDEENKDVIMLFVNDGQWDANWWSNKLIRHDGYNAVIVIRADRDKLSLRTSKDRMGWFHGGEWLQENIINDNGSKGGHQHAAGCSLVGVSNDEILEIGMKIQVLCDEHFRPEEKEMEA